MNRPAKIETPASTRASMSNLSSAMPGNRVAPAVAGGEQPLAYRRKPHPRLPVSIITLAGHSKTAGAMYQIHGEPLLTRPAGPGVNQEM